MDGNIQCLVLCWDRIPVYHIFYVKCIFWKHLVFILSFDRLTDWEEEREREAKGLQMQRRRKKKSDISASGLRRLAMRGGVRRIQKKIMLMPQELHKAVSPAGSSFCFISFLLLFFRLSKTLLSLLNMKGRPGSQPATSSGQWRETLGTPTFWSKLNSQVCTYDCASSLLCNQINFLTLHYLILKYNLISLKGFHFFKQLAGSTMRSCGFDVISYEICNHDIFWFWCNILIVVLVQSHR